MNTLKLITGPHNEAAIAALKSKAPIITIFSKPGRGKSATVNTYKRPNDHIVDFFNGEVTRDDVYRDERVIVMLPQHPRDCGFSDTVMARLACGAIVEIGEWARVHLAELLPDDMPEAAREVVLERCKSPSECVGAATTWRATDGVADWRERLRGVLGNVVSRTTTISPYTVLESVCEFYNVPVIRMIGPQRTKPLVEYRHIAIFLARELCAHATMSSIGTAFGGRDHSTVLHAINKMKALMLRDKGVAGEVDIIRGRLLRREKWSSRKAKRTDKAHGKSSSDSDTTSCARY